MKLNNENYAQRATFYDLEFNDTSDRAILSSLITQETKKILEIPCGSGRNCEWLASTGREIIFADLSQQMIEMVNAKLRALPFKHKVLGVCADMKEYKARI